ncbi:hypothetical protein SAMN05444422_104300 [Halobiforma haloterrestris]|uniref:Uncharacterized protein n=1 Tax=Natronobacterium haloterrestre TaxID=148448 RepID=A0A1I1GGJ0_NATHA|nr:hypothetical protein [Halobiforma haloterrestris]SFC10664.1 hypothetical protein SAMN05444422_104300 [Halobiforma haloterrestris]
MRQGTSTSNERGQAYTLEGFIGAMIVLTAVLLALQSVVITPTTGGAADRSVQAQIQQETQDALVVAAATDDEANLSAMVRHWDGDGGFNGTDQPGPEEEVYTVEDFSEKFVLGKVLDKRFTEAGQNYNVELHYLNETATGDRVHENRSLVVQGSPSSDAVTASYTVSLFDNQSVTSNEGAADTIREAADNDSESIPRLDDTGEELYNVVEVRVIVW